MNETRSFPMFLQLWSQKASLMNLQTPTPCQKQISHKVHGKMSSKTISIVEKAFSQQQIFPGDKGGATMSDIMPHWQKAKFSLFK